MRETEYGLWNLLMTINLKDISLMIPQIRQGFISNIISLQDWRKCFDLQSLDY